MSTAQNLLVDPSCGYSPAPVFPETWKDMCMYDQWVQHPGYQCAIYTWLVKGLVKDKEHQILTRYYLYMEYRQSTGNSHHLLKTFDTLEAARHYQNHSVATLVFPRISPRDTRNVRIPPSPD